VSTPYGYQPDPNQGGQGGQYDATQFAPAPQFGQGGQQPSQPQAQQYGQAPSYDQAAPQYGQAAPGYGQAAPQYGQAPQYGAAQPQYGQAGYGAASPYGPYPAGLGGTGAAPGTYLAGAPATFGQAVSEGVKNTFTWRGRASLSAFWWLYLATGGVNLVLCLIIATAGSVGLVLFGLLLMTAIALPSLGALVRRLHDTGRSGSYYWMSLIPIVGPILLLVALCEAPAQGPNQYG
jgi:uncharacterized membrane protein YhaH (DUF805 family)